MVITPEISKGATSASASLNAFAHQPLRIYYHAPRITRARIRFSFRHMRGRLLYARLAHTFDTAKLDDGISIAGPNRRYITKQYPFN